VAQQKEIDAGFLAGCNGRTDLCSDGIQQFQAFIFVAILVDI